MDDDITVRIADLIRSDEGLRLTAYQDTRGVWTIGYGYNLQAHGYTKTQAAQAIWTKDRAERALSGKIGECVAYLDRTYSAWRNLTGARQAVCVSAVYQLGPRAIPPFAPTIALICRGEYAAAAARMRATAWARQTPNRVRRLADMMATGEWPTKE